MTVQEFIDKHLITMHAKQIDARPDGSLCDLPNHYECFLFIPGRVTALETHFSRGAAWNPERDYTPRKHSMGDGGRRLTHYGGEKPWTMFPPLPTAVDVLDSLLSDARDADFEFEEWARDFGYGTDSRSAERIWRACQDSARKLRNFLGLEAYSEALACEPM